MTTTITKKDHSRRKMVLIPQHDVMRMFTTPHLENLHILNVWRPVELPEGFKVCGCYPDYSNQAICFIVEHESFNEVPDCCELPTMRLTFQEVKVELMPETALELANQFFEEIHNDVAALAKKIESEFPASSQQTEVSLAVSEILQKFQRVTNPGMYATNQ